MAQQDRRDIDIGNLSGIDEIIEITAFIPSIPQIPDE